jgi:DNA-binding response OmpR family regulator
VTYKILIVEDDLDTREALRLYLKLEGFTVIIASDGKEGIEAAISQNPDLIITDAHMPNLDGVEMTKRLRANPVFRGLPIIILAGLGSALEHEAISAGADEIVIKPAGPDLLVSKVHRLLKP